MIPLLIAGGVLAFTGYKAYKNREKSLSSPAKTPNNSTKKTSGAEQGQHISKEQGQLPVSIESEADELEKSTQKEFLISSTSLGLTTLGAFIYPPLLFPAMLGFGYVSIPLWKQGYESLFKKRKVDISVVYSVAFPSIFFSGYYLLGAIDYWLYSLSEVFLQRTKRHTKRNIVGIFNDLPATVWVVKDGSEFEIPIKRVNPGDIAVVNAGEVVPVDGIVTRGIASVDQHMLTGESQPAEKPIGEQVLASSVVLSGRIFIRVEKSGENTAAAEIGKILSKTLDFRSTRQLQGEKFADQSAAPTLAASLLALPLAGRVGSLAVLGSGTGDSIRISAPLSTLNFIKLSSESGIFIKDGRALELLAKVDTIVFDKTGTLTQDQPYIGKIHAFHNYGEDELLRYAATAEHRQSHPIAKAIKEEAKRQNIKTAEIDDTRYEIGYGIKVDLLDKVIRVGSVLFMEREGVSIPSETENILSASLDSGFSVILIAIDNQVAGAIELHPSIRPEAEEIIKSLHQHHLSPYIISGDHENPTKRIAEHLGIQNYFAQTLPEDKGKLIEQLKKEGKTVCFVGDGINDSISLKKADVSISLHGASTIALDTAQVIFTDGSLNQLPYLFDLSKKLASNQKTGLALSIIPGVVTIGGVFLFHLGIAGSILLYYAGLGAGMSNAMFPLITHRASIKKNGKELLPEKNGKPDDQPHFEREVPVLPQDI